MGRKLMMIFALFVLTGCMPYLKQDFKSYSFDGKEIRLGMTTGDVREIAGKATKIKTSQEPVFDITDNTMFADDFAHAYQFRLKSYRECWQYGSLRKGDKEQLRIMFVDGIVTDIQKFTKK